jgi:hypothetical protein
MHGSLIRALDRALASAVIKLKLQRLMKIVYFTLPKQHITPENGPWIEPFTRPGPFCMLEDKLALSTTRTLRINVSNRCGLYGGLMKSEDGGAGGPDLSNSTFLPPHTDEHTYTQHPARRDIIQQGHIVMCIPQSEAAAEIIFSRCRCAQEDTRGLLLSLIMFRDVAAYTGVTAVKIRGRPPR